MNVFWISSLVILSTSAESIDNHIRSFLTGAYTCEIKHSYELVCWDAILLVFDRREMGPVSLRVCVFVYLLINNAAGLFTCTQSSNTHTGMYLHIHEERVSNKQHVTVD